MRHIRREENTLFSRVNISECHSEKKESKKGGHEYKMGKGAKKVNIDRSH
jgi:hypothetical protein